MTEDKLKEPRVPLKPEKNSVFRVIIHSFFVVPFLIAIFAVLVYLMVMVLTVEPNTAQDYLNQIKIGGATKRWQGAFELSKILANPKLIPTDERFVNDMISTFEYSAHERDPRIRSYLAMAMGRTKDQRYTKTLITGLNNEHVSIAAACAYALGMIHSGDGFKALLTLSNHEDPQVRLQTVIALGNYLNPDATDIFLKTLKDDEVNVRWDAAIALAKLGNNSGRRILLDLLDRKYLDLFPNIDPVEQDHAMLVAIQVVPNILDTEFKETLIELLKNDRSMQVREAVRNVLEN